MAAFLFACTKPAVKINDTDVVIDNNNGNSPNIPENNLSDIPVLKDDEIKKISQEYILKLPEYARNNGSKLTYVRHNPLPKNTWNVVYRYDVHTENLPSSIVKQDVHLLLENNKVSKYVVMEVSNNTVS
jgi:hypothetical protein